MRKNVTLAGLVVLLSTASMPVHAQYAIINDVIAQTVMNMSSGAPCINMPASELAEARDPAPGIMQGYFAAAAGGGKKSASFKLNKKAKWSAGGVISAMADIDTQTDPLAVAGNSLNPDPLRFFRAGTFGTALGQWAVRDAGGGVVGVYTAMFEREKNVWKLRELTVSKADEVVEPIAAYCQKPGDTTGQRVISTETNMVWAERQVEKRKAKLADAIAKANAGEAMGSATVTKLRQAVAREQKKLVQSEETLGKAREAYAEAVADADEITRLTQPARQAEQMREMDTASTEE